ncbi:MAG: hypothetical protein MSC31_07150 [Solirubrobacteraceae bacterium MAG38_C4-C5]|nr:hypothetical protein [Candidatus Siliceabacter maunaloa]
MTVPKHDEPRHPWVLRATLTLITVGVAVLLATSDPSGSDAENVGFAAGEGELAPVVDALAPPRSADEDPAAAQSPEPAPRNCEATASNAGGDNNYIPGAPELDDLGDGFVITGRVRSAGGCRALEGIPVRVWLATQTGTERDNRATVLTGPDGVFSLETDPTIPQFGEPNIHVGYDGDRYETVFVRRVVDLDDEKAVVNLTLAEDR